MSHIVRSPCWVQVASIFIFLHDYANLCRSNAEANRALTHAVPLGTVAFSAFRFIPFRRSQGNRQLERPHCPRARSAILPSPEFETSVEWDPERSPGPEIEAFVDALIASLPEFIPGYLDLVEGFDDDPGEPVVFIELADFVADRLAAIEAERPVLERALGLIETLVETIADRDEAYELVGMAFFDSFSPEDRRRLVPWLGPGSRAALETLDMPSRE